MHNPAWTATADPPARPDFEPSSDAGFLGALFVDEDGQATVTEILGDTAAEKAGMKAGDKIWKVDGNLIGSVDDLKNAIGGFKAGDAVKIEFERDGEREKIEVKLGRRP